MAAMLIQVQQQSSDADGDEKIKEFSLSCFSAASSAASSASSAASAVSAVFKQIIPTLVNTFFLLHVPTILYVCSHLSCLFCVILIFLS